MSVMSRVEGVFCRSAPWGVFADRVILPLVDDDPPWAGTVLEIGGGAGAMADRLLREHDGIDRLILADVDPAMIAAAEKRLAHHGERAEAVLTDGGLPVPDESVDIVCAWLMLHHVIDWKPLVERAFRVLRPGGRLLGYDLSAGVLGEVLHGVSGSEHLLIDPAELRRELAHVGFEAVEVRPRLLGQLMTFRAVRP
ncbi:MAG: class I SAM-dependent methyltransferase [Gordonia sp. (in: high G+C Gram-positive bacteria)]|uniref:class I SAM-dependent methyltransferase n=1 Tax=Gordonia sp. (in: high G+C Gram-positive bacteria) TaxID=84139 RepID=UPI0039E6C6B7